MDRRWHLPARLAAAVLGRLAQTYTVSKATARHALTVLVETGHARHVESKPHQVIWRLADHAGGPGDAG